MKKILELYNNIAPDKKGHITLGLLIGLSLGAKPIIAGVAILIAALGKETYDYLYNLITKTKKHGVEVLDALATIGGGVLGVLTIYLVDVIL